MNKNQGYSRFGEFSDEFRCETVNYQRLNDVKILEKDKL